MVKILMASLLSLPLSACTILKPDAWPRGSGKIILTFDDGPTPGEGTDLLLDVLKKHRVKATFCVIGRNVERNPAAVRRIVEEGHVAANHTFDHRLFLLSAGKMDAEIEKTDEAIRSATGNAKFRTALFRPPYGVVTPAVAFSREASARKLAYLTMYLGDAEVDAAHVPMLLEGLKKRLMREGGGAVISTRCAMYRGLRATNRQRSGCPRRLTTSSYGFGRMAWGSPPIVPVKQNAEEEVREGS